MNCYLSRNYKGLGSAGNKAKTDMEKIMKDMNFRNVGLPQSISKNTLRHFFTTLFSVIKSVFCMRRGEETDWCCSILLRNTSRSYAVWHI